MKKLIFVLALGLILACFYQSAFAMDRSDLYVRSCDDQSQVILPIEEYEILRGYSLAELCAIFGTEPQFFEAACDEDSHVVLPLEEYERFYSGYSVDELCAIFGEDLPEF